MGLRRHLLVLSALVVNLWLGGDLVEAVAGHYARGGFELLLILGYMVLVLRVRFPFRSSGAGGRGEP